MISLWRRCPSANQQMTRCLQGRKAKSRLVAGSSLLLQQLLLSRKPPTIPGEGPALANDAMAGYHDGNGVRGASSRNSANGLGLSERPRYFRVRARLAARNPLQFLPYPPLKRRRLQVEREFQSRPFAFDALHDLPHPALERIRGGRASPPPTFFHPFRGHRVSRARPQ